MPIHVKLAGKRCIVVGGGCVAERRIEKLLSAEAAILVVSPRVTGRIERWGRDGLIELAKRPFSSGDTAGAFLAVAATDDARVNAQVCREAESSGILVNGADDASKGNAVFPGILSKGRLLLSISTSGAGPAVTAGLLDEAAARYTENTTAYLDFYAELRLKTAEIVKDRKQRTALLRRVAGLDYPEAFDAPRLSALKAKMDALLHDYQQGHAEMAELLDKLQDV